MSAPYGVPYSNQDPADCATTLGSNIMRSRLRKGLTRREVETRMADDGYERAGSLIYRYEMLGTAPRPAQLKRIADAIGVTVATLTKGEVR